MSELNREKIVIEIRGLIKALKANNGWWENRGRGGWFNHDILEDALALITSQEQRIKELTGEKKNLEYTLAGVMHSVDKWLDGAELEQDEVNRAATMREKTLQIVERLTAENERLRENCKPPIARNIDILKATTKADTAREIFEEIDKLLDEHMVKLTYIDGTCTLVFKRTLEIGIAELKKKFTEGI